MDHSAGTGHSASTGVQDAIDEVNRIPAAAGILYIVVSLVAVVFEFSGPDVLDTPEDVAQSFTDERGAALSASTLFCVASVLYLIFLIGLVSILRRVESRQLESRRGAVPLGSFVMAMGAISIAVFMVYVMIYGSLTTSIVDDASPETVLALLRTGNALDALSGFFAGLVMAVASGAFLRARILARWVSWLGLLGGACMAIPVVTFGTDGFWPALGAVAVFGLLFQVVWMVAFNVAVLRHASPRAMPPEHAQNLLP